ncbi:MAG: Chemotaxis protein [Clostridiales bacterium]|jgi:chemotaxis protein MotB|nr:Chemotaxis protein [Clostridiales bacterium]
MARKIKQDEVKAGAPEWMNTYGDMVTLLLCFFVLLFSMSSVDVAKFKALVSVFNTNVGFLEGGTSLTEGSLIASGVSQLSELDIFFVNIAETALSVEKQEAVEEYKEKEEQERMEQAETIAEELQEGLIESNIADDVVITYNSQYILLSLKGAVLFDSGKAVIRNDAIDLVDKLGKLLKSYEEYTIAVEGHTDNVPMNTLQFPSNRHLSSGRAISVVEYFIAKNGFEDKNLSAVGYGEFRPVVSNDTAEGRAQNRRVEIKIKNTLLSKIGD